MVANPRLIDKELSWLSFNERVLQEAADKTVPIIERIRFLGIYSNNMDEFFRVRFAAVRRLASIAEKTSLTQRSPRQLLEEMQTKVVQLQQRFDQLYKELIIELARRNIFLVNEHQLDEAQGKFVRRYFIDKVLPILSPIRLESNRPFPTLKDQFIYLLVELSKDDQKQYWLVDVPTQSLSRFVMIPASTTSRRRKSIIILDNMIRYCMKDLLGSIVDYDKASAYTIKLTRDAEFELGDGISQSLIDRVASSLQQRKNAELVRFVYDREMPPELLQFLADKLHLTRYDSLNPGDRYHNFKDFIGFPNVGRQYLENPRHQPIAVQAFEQFGSVFEAIAANDILVHYPYHSFRYFINLLREAALDPKVVRVQISLYRVARDSQVINALINAVKNGKQVTVVVELQARFDEHANIEWSKRLTEEGVKVIFGIPGLKVHSKLCLITRLEQNVERLYSSIGTGNFHENTAKIYTDFNLFTANQELGREVAQVFEFINYPYREFEYQHLMVSPRTNRSGFNELIDFEIGQARQRRKAAITLKLNNLADVQIIDKLYEASQAGVKIRLIVRGMCSLKAGVPGLSENIEAISIVDKFLEHPRLYLFHHAGDERCYLSSADWMTRNLDHRVEVTCPVLEPRLQKVIRDILDIQWKDNQKARILDAEQTNAYRPVGNRKKVRSQEQIYRYLTLNRL